MTDGNEATDLTSLPLTLGETATDEPKENEPEPNPELDALNKRIDDMREDFKGERDTFSRTIDRLIQGGQVGATPNGEQNVAPLDFTDLPDPVEKPKEFQAELNKRLTTRLTQVTANVSASVDQSQRASNLWNDFKTEHSEFNEKGALANVVAADVMKNHGGAEWAFDNQKQFKQEVAAEMHKQLGTKPAEAAKDDADKGGKPAANRTAGLSAGSKEGTGVVSKSADVVGFVKSLKNQQVKDGLI